MQTHQAFSANPTFSDFNQFKPITDKDSLNTALEAWIEDHDEAAALISHLPVVISSALLKTVGEVNSPSLLSLAKVLCSSGFADTTRVGGGNPQLGTSMAESNTAAILRGLAAYRWSLEQLEEAVLNGHWSQLKAELERSQALRPSFLVAANNDLNSPLVTDDLAEP